MGAEHGAERADHVARPLAAGDAEIRHHVAAEGEALPRERCHRGGGVHTHGRVQGPPPAAASRLDGQGQESDQAERREQGAGEEREARAGVAPGDREPAEREHAVGERRGLRDVAQWEDRREERDCEPEPRCAERREPSREGEEHQQRGGPERQQRSSHDGRERGEARGRDSLRERDRRGRHARAFGRARAPRRRPGSRAALEGRRQRLAELGREPPGRRPPGGVDRQSRLDGGDEPPGEVAAPRRERRRPRGDGGGDVLERHAPEGMAPGERLPEDHSHRPHVAPLGRLAAVEALRRDVGQRPRHVADSGEGVRLVELRETEVEHARGQLVSVLDEHVGGLDVAVHDPAPVRVREALEDLRGELDRRGVVQLAHADQLAQGAAADVLVGDVHVPVVAAEVVGAHATLVPQAGRRLHLPCRACRALALARHDLERHLEPGALVAREPDGSGAAPAERAERPVAVEDERAVGKGEGSRGHRSCPSPRKRIVLPTLRGERGPSSAAECAVHSTASGRSARARSSGGRTLARVIT